MLLKVSAIVVLSVGTCVGQLDLQVSALSSHGMIPLTKALADISLHINDGYVLLGIDIATNAEPEVDVSVADLTSLGVVLSQIMSQAQGFTFQAASQHVIDVRPVEVESRAEDVMNIQVRHFAVTDEPAMNIFSRPTHFMPELRDYLATAKSGQKSCGSIGQGIGSGGPGVTLELEGGTVRQVLDAVAEADAELSGHARDHSLPVGWVHRTKQGSKAIPEHEWSFMSTVPHGWERFLHEQKDGN